MIPDLLRRLKENVSIRMTDSTMEFFVVLRERAMLYVRLAELLLINISHGGISDVRKHLATSKHQQLVKAAGSCGDLIRIIPQSPTEDTVTRAEVLFANFIAEHNLPFATANHFTHLTHAMFPDSKIARAFSCARTKTTCIVKGALNPHFTDPVIQLCKNGPFSILCDEDSDTDDKHLAIWCVCGTMTLVPL